MKIIACLLFLLALAANADENKYDYQGAFTKIYENKHWKEGPNGPLSGSGSMPCRYIAYLTSLQHIIDWPQVRKIVQIGFGDFEIMQHIILQNKLYFGHQVVPLIMRPSTSNQKFILISSLKDITEVGDLLIVRDVMMHWPTSQIEYFLDHMLPKYQYAFITNDVVTKNVTNSLNKDIVPGSYRPLNLQKIKPFSQTILQFKAGGSLKETLLYQSPNFK